MKAHNIARLDALELVLKARQALLDAPYSPEVHDIFDKLGRTWDYLWNTRNS